MREVEWRNAEKRDRNSRVYALPSRLRPRVLSRVSAAASVYPSEPLAGHVPPGASLWFGAMMARGVKVYMPFYVGDYLADTGQLTLEAHGAYFLLLINMWRREGSLSAAPSSIRRILRCDKEQFLRVWKEIEEFFPESGGRITNSRITRELKRLRKWSEAGKTAGLKSAESRRERKREKERSGNDSPTIGQRSSQRSGNDKATIDPTIDPTIEPTTRQLSSSSSSSVSESPSEGEQAREPGPRPERAEDIELPQNLKASSTFVEAWKHWLKHRRENRWTTKPGWAKGQLKSLAKHGPAVASAAIQESMIQGWQGVFPGKVGKGAADQEPAHRRVHHISPKYRRPFKPPKANK